MPETCNGEDDDCDGIVDNEPAADEWCVAQDGAGAVCESGSCVGGASVSLSTEVQPIFTQHCATVGCHIPGDPAEGLVLVAGFAYSNLVNVLSLEVPSLRRVAPSDVAASYLYEKITMTQPTVGTIMPPLTTGDVLSTEDTNTIMNWIAAGAPNN